MAVVEGQVTGDKYAGSNWIRQSLKKPMGEFGERVADILGIAYAGIYHLSTKQLEKVNWEDPFHIAVIVYGGISTIDARTLTTLVLLAHDRCIRLEITGKGPRYLELSFSKRKRGIDGMTCHPTIEEAWAWLKSALPPVEFSTLSPDGRVEGSVDKSLEEVRG